jgi:hypothetical protein
VNRWAVLQAFNTTPLDVVCLDARIILHRMAFNTTPVADILARHSHLKDKAWKRTKGRDGTLAGARI